MAARGAHRIRSSVDGVSAAARTVTLASGRVEYRYQKRGRRTALICHGGHLSAGVPVGEEVFEQAGFSVLAPSRPGYGGTPLAAGPGPDRFADVVRELWQHLDLRGVDVVVGFSAGSPLAVTLAARYPEEVGALVLQSARSSLPWPDPLTQTLAAAFFEPSWQAMALAGARTWMGLMPDVWLLSLLATMSRRPAQQVLADLSPVERHEIRRLFSRMRSGPGFVTDLRELPDAALERAVTQPTLVVGSPHDALLPFAHSEHLASTIGGAELFASPSLSHLLWYGSGAAATSARIGAFAAAHTGPAH